MKNRFTPLHRTLLAAVLAAAATCSAQAQSVGIGTTAPNAAAALDVVSSDRGVLLPRLSLTQRGNILNPATGLIIYQTDNTPGFYYNSGSSGAPMGAPMWERITTATDAVMATNGLTKTGQAIGLGGTLTGATTIAQGTNAFSLTGGNVGIGTATPSATLDLDGFMKIRGNNTLEFGAGLSKDINAGKIGYGTFSSGGALDIVGAGTNASNRYVNVFAEGGTYFTGKIVGAGTINVDNNSTNNGTPTNTLLFGALTSGEAIGSKRTAGNNLNGLDFYTNGSNSMAITNAGNVGIGTGSINLPQYKLDVVGVIHASNNIIGDGTINVDGKATNVGDFRNTLLFGELTSGEAIGSKRTVGNNRYGLDFYANYLNRMTITHDGNVGIGTTTPSATLELVGVPYNASAPTNKGGGFIRLAGANITAAPAFAMAKIVDTMPASVTTQQKAISLPTGILGVKVLSITALVTVPDATTSPTVNAYYPPNSGISGVNGVAYQVYVAGDQVIIQTDTTSGSVNGKAISILITYEQ